MVPICHSNLKCNFTFDRIDNRGAFIVLVRGLGLVGRDQQILFHGLPQQLGHDLDLLSTGLWNKVEIKLAISRNNLVGSKPAKKIITTYTGLDFYRFLRKGLNIEHFQRSFRLLGQNDFINWNNKSICRYGWKR